jgi:putative ABC transport system substrate-binding protein
MRRRKFIALLGGAAVSWPCAGGAQQGERVRRIGVLTPLASDDPEHLARLAAFSQELQQLGWAVGSNVRIETRAGARPDRGARIRGRTGRASARRHPCHWRSVVGPLLQVTRSVPVVFTQTPDPVGAGFVDSLARPGRNATGFLLFEYGISGKWLELLKEIVPQMTRAAVLRDTTSVQGTGQFGAIQSVAPSLGVELRPIDVRDAGEIERAVTSFSGTSNGGLIVTASGLANVHRQLIISLAARHRLPAIYFLRLFAADGGLISYGPDSIDPHRRAAGYVDRILKGANPADLPVQAPTKYELVINLRAAKALGLDVPPMLLARADEVIE